MLLSHWAKRRFEIGEGGGCVTSLAEENWRGLRAPLRSVTDCSRSNRAWAMLDSNSEGVAWEGELAAILTKWEVMVADLGGLFCWLGGRRIWRRSLSFGLSLP